MKKALKNIVLLLCVACLLLNTACAGKSVMMTESSHTLYLWEQGISARYGERYELAHEYMTLALSGATNTEAIRQIGREIIDLERMIKTRR